MWAKRVGVGWLAYDLTQSVFWVGIVAAVDLMPSVLVAPWAGSLGDRYNRLLIIRMMQLIAVTASVMLFLILITGSMTVGLLVTLAFFDGIAQAVKQPSRMALVRSLVPSGSLAAAIALNAISFNLARFLGPALAGFLILSFDIAAVFVVSTAGALTLLWVTFLIHPAPTRNAGGHQDQASLIQNFIQALRWSMAQPLIAMVFLFAASLALLLRGFIELLPGFAAEVMQRGPEGLAALTSAIGIGAVIGGLWLGQRPDQRNLFKLVVGSGVVSCLIMAVIAVGLSFVATLFAIGALGATLSIAGVGAQTLVQAGTPEDRLSRVLSIYGLILRAGPATGALILGAAADRFGFAIPMAIASMICLVITWGIFRRAGDPATMAIRSARA